MTTIIITVEGATTPVAITDEHAASSYGIPVAVVNGQAYGPADPLPIWGKDDPLAWLREPAAMTVAAAVIRMQREGDSNAIDVANMEFVRRFWS